ncbi:MAG: FliM/FliN family flagellar motor switch protein [Beijerinckiaceae bacterium]|nr:FliM/FliN family flagellar motor switch protein [Beijerinckiaceae bacterium]
MMPASDIQASRSRAAAHPLLARPHRGADHQALMPLFEAVAAALLAGTRKLAATPFAFALQAIDEERTAERLATAQGGCVAALFEIAEPAGTLAILIEHPLVFSVAEAVLGGDGLERPFTAERPLSRIERSMARLVADHVAQALRTALDGVLTVDLAFDRLESDLEFVDLGRSSPTVLAVGFEVEAIGRKAAFSILVPAAFATALRKTVAHATPAGPQADPAWSRQLDARVRQADIRLDAVFIENDLTLADIAALEIGKVLRLTARQSSPLILQCDARPLFHGRMGQSDGRYAVRIDDGASEEPILAESLQA